MPRLTLATIVGCIMMLAQSFALAHGPDAHGARHGGDMQHIGANHLELTIEDGKLVAYITDVDTRALPTDGVEIGGIILIGGNQRQVVFTPAGGNRLVAGGDFDAASELRAVLTVTLPDGEVHRARFQLTR